jgi:hypothetical protein
MDTRGLAGQARWLHISVPLAFALAVAGVAASALNAYTAGYVLFAAAAISYGSAYVLLRVLRHRSRSSVRVTQARQQTGLGNAFWSGSRQERSLPARHGDGDKTALAGVKKAAARPRRQADETAGQPHPDQVSFGERGGCSQAPAPGPPGPHLPAAEAGLGFAPPR